MVATVARAAAAAALQMAVVTPLIDGAEWDVYWPLVETHRGFVPRYDEAAVAVAAGAAVVAVAVAPMLPGRLAAMAELVATVAMAVASGYVAKDYGESQPGAGLWLAWAAIVVTNWASALEKPAYRPA